VAAAAAAVGRGSVAAARREEAVALAVSEGPPGAAAEPLGVAGDEKVALVGYYC
jgi:hypothetical protein